jgi:hypothetical protein
VLVVQAISLQVELVQQEQELLLAAAVAVQDLLALAQTHLLTMAVLAAQAAAVAAALLQQVLQVQAVTALSFYTTKEF